MSDALFRVPSPVNEPVLDYAPGSSERRRLEAELKATASEEIEIPCVIGGRRIETGTLQSVVMPCDHRHVLARFHAAGPNEIAGAIDAAIAARREWSRMPWKDRSAILLRAAEALAGKQRMRINAATMLGQSKTCHQAEIDAACEFIDFLRFNVHFAEQLYADQPRSTTGVWNALEMRPLEGFVLALTPFNFTAIAGNLPTAPALLGNGVVWKPSESQTLAAWVTMQVLEEAGLPPGVINFLPGSGADVAAAALDHPEFAGLHFTGSTFVFRKLWQRIGQNLDRYRSYPRVVGETGGKDFIVAHSSADPEALIAAIVRGAFEFQGQKCSAASRLYIAASVWKNLESRLVDTINGMAMGDVRDFSNFVGAVIKREAFAKHAAAIDEARAGSATTILAGGTCDDSRGFFVRPTLIRSTDPKSRTMVEELFGPIATVFVYDDARWHEVLALIDSTSPYALTGAVFANDRRAVVEATHALRDSAGNFYINDKPTGAVVGQQPFGGGRASGTNDKAGSAQNLLRWASARTLKEVLAPVTNYRYPYMG